MLLQGMFTKKKAKTGSKLVILEDHKVFKDATDVKGYKVYQDAMDEMELKDRQDVTEKMY